MTIKVVCNGCGEPAQHTVGLNVLAFPDLAPKRPSPYSSYDDEDVPYVDLTPFNFDFCGKEECFQGCVAEQKLKIDTFKKGWKKNA